MTEFERLYADDTEGIEEMSAMASSIVREHFDPLIGKQQNDYMIAMFQTPQAIREQMTHGSRYYFVNDGGRKGFLAFYPKGSAMYLSKFYLYRHERHKGYARAMLDFVKAETAKEHLSAIELNVNRFNEAVQSYLNMGFEIVREENNSIGNGFYMDDYVMRLSVDEQAE